MSPKSDRCEHLETTSAYAAKALPANEIVSAEGHIASCPSCQWELESLRGVVTEFTSWPMDVLRPDASLQARLAACIATDSGEPLALPPRSHCPEPQWDQAAPGIECRLLTTDLERSRVCMLVRLAPGASYPAHTHSDVEELHLLDGELWIDERKLFPGDYNFAAPGSSDTRVQSETGCTCLLITSTRDVLNDDVPPTNSAAQSKP
jgi:hypothetical protein